MRTLPAARATGYERDRPHRVTGSTLHRRRVRFDPRQREGAGVIKPLEAVNSVIRRRMEKPQGATLLFVNKTTTLLTR